MADYQPKLFPAHRMPWLVTSNVEGGWLITAAGAYAQNGSTTVIGIAAFDQVAGGMVTVIRTGIHTMLAIGPISAGQLVCSAGGGNFVRLWISGADPVPAWIGRAVSSAAGTGAPVDVALNRV